MESHEHQEAIGPRAVGLPSNLRERALLYRCSLHSWGAVRKDNQATAAAQAVVGARRGTGNYQKFLISPDALKPIKQIDGQIRTFIGEHSLPWDDGKVLVPSIRWEWFSQELRGLFAQRRAAVSQFEIEYPSYVERAQRELGSLFQAGQYPPADRIVREFKVTEAPEPIPERADLRLDLPQAAIEEMRGQLQADLEARFRAAHTEAGQRLMSVVDRLAVRLQTVAGSEPVIFRDSLVENVRELCDSLPSLNLAGDAQLDQFIAEVKEKLTRYSPGQLREIPGIRQEVAENAGDILRRMRGYCGEAE